MKTSRHLFGLMKAVEEIGADVFGEARPPEPPRKVTLTPGGLPVHIASTPFFLRFVNNSGFEARATVVVTVSPTERAPGEQGGDIFRVGLDVEVETWNEKTSATFVSLLTSSVQGVAAQWHVFQEARRYRRKRQSEWRIGPAQFRFELFTIDDI